MKTLADDWPKALLNGVLVGAILFLSILPALGWAWHRVLPEHTHVFIGATHSDADEILPAALSPDDPGLCLDCTTPQMSSGIVHLPSAFGLQVLGVVATLGVIFLCFVPPAFPERVIFPPFLYQSPILLLLDPPPNTST